MQAQVQNLLIWGEIAVNGVRHGIQNAPEHLRQDRINEAFHFLTFMEKGVFPVVADNGMGLANKINELKREMSSKPETPMECKVCPAVKRLEDFVAAFYANLRAEKGGGK